jgi:hypothetical protein
MNKAIFLILILTTLLFSKEAGIYWEYDEDEVHKTLENGDYIYIDNDDKDKL